MQDWTQYDFYEYVQANRFFNIAVVVTISFCIIITILFVGFKLCQRVEALRQYWLKDKKDDGRFAVGHCDFTAALQNDNDSIL